jgi:hypothetical protein
MPRRSRAPSSSTAAIRSRDSSSASLAYAVTSLASSPDSDTASTLSASALPEYPQYARVLRSRMPRQADIPSSAGLTGDRVTSRRRPLARPEPFLLAGAARVDPGAGGGVVACAAAASTAAGGGLAPWVHRGRGGADGRRDAVPAGQARLIGAGPRPALGGPFQPHLLLNAPDVAGTVGVASWRWSRLLLMASTLR